MSTFDERAPEWDTPERVERALAAARLVLDTVQPAPTARVLELGAGTGLMGLALLPHVGSVVLADASIGMLEVADTKLASGGFAGARTMRLELTVDPPPGEQFELVTTLLALHHVRDTDAALADLAAMVAPGGQLALIDLDAEDGSFHSDPSAPVIHGYEREDLRRRVEAAGFTDVTFRWAWDVIRDDRTYPLFLMTAVRAG